MADNIEGHFCGQTQPHPAHEWKTLTVYGQATFVGTYQCAGASGPTTMSQERLPRLPDLFGGPDACGCWKCHEDRGQPIRFMIVCALCGNKRCPHANDHHYDCTASNEPGQPGSAYEHGSGAASARRADA